MSGLDFPRLFVSPARLPARGLTSHRGSLRLRLACLSVVWLVVVAPAGVPVRGAAATAARFFDKARGDSTDDQLTDMARRNVLVFGVDPDQLPVLRAVNPSLKAILYAQPAGTNKKAKDYGYIDAHETWWVHDAKGSRMHEMKGGSNWIWLLNIGRTAYRTYIQDRILTAVFASNYDGVFLDTSGPAWALRREWYDVNDRPTSPTDDVLNNWPDWMVSFHQELGPLLGNRLHIFNGWPMGPGTYEDFKSWYEATLAAVEGVQFDGFCYNRTQPWSLTMWQFQVSQARRLANKGKVLLLKTPLDGLRGDLPKLRQLQGLCFGTYLLVADGKYALFRNVDELDVAYWNERLFTAPIGQPAGSYYTVGPVYRRDYTNGTVVVNPTTTSSYRVDLGGIFYTLGGLPVTSILAHPLTGEVLLSTPPAP